MALSTYAELQASVADWLARSDLTDAIPDFIALAEAKFNRELRVPQMDTRATYTIDTDVDEPAFLTLPGDFQSMRRIRLSSVTGQPTLSFLSTTQLDEYRTTRADSAGQPYYFSIFGTQIEFAPTPDSGYTVEMIYRANIPALTDSNTTNWLLTLAPDAYLFGSLMQAALYIKDDPRVALWQAAHDRAVAGLQNLNLTMGYNAGPMTMRISGTVV